MTAARRTNLAVTDRAFSLHTSVVKARNGTPSSADSGQGLATGPSLVEHRRVRPRDVFVDPVAFAAGLLLLAAPVGCMRPCDEVLESGTTYVATVLEPYSDHGRFPGPDPISRGMNPSCADLDGIQEGSEIAIKMTGRDDGTGNCAGAIGLVTAAPPAVKLESTFTIHNGGHALLAAGALATLSSCKGLWTVELFWASQS